MRTLSRAAILAAHLLAAAALAEAALAQTVAPPPPATTPATPPAGSVGSTVTGGLPAQTGSTTAVGRTKPAGAPVGDELGTRPDLQRKSRDLDRRIDTGICTGCK